MTLSRKIAHFIIQKNIDISDVVGMLRTYNLLSLLPSIRNAVVAYSRSKEQDSSICIESPFDLDSTALARIKRIVGNDLAETEVIINKHILAGFKARYKGRLYDGSAERIITQLTK